MQIKVPPGNSDNLLEAREQRLMAFAAAGIERFSDTGAGTTAASILAVARSADSPVVRALVALRTALVDKAAHIRLVISDDDVALDPFIAGSADQSTRHVSEVRIIRDPRLRDAHEQLIIGGTSVWFGDSLRRDMNRRDLFEQFHADAPDAARAAANGFQQLWNRTEPCLSLPALAADSLSAIPGAKTRNTGPAGSALC
jgi:hypothetical protein